MKNILAAIVMLNSLSTFASGITDTIFVGNTRSGNGCAAGNLVGGVLFVTAAHCVEMGLDVAYAGQDPANPSSADVYKIKQTYKYPKYSYGDWANDIGFILLEKPIPNLSDPSIKNGTLNVSRGTSLTSYGYFGGTRNSKLLTSIAKENGSLTVSCDDCGRGDSGGPVYLDGNLFGVYSAETLGANKHFIAPLTQQAVDWIETMLR